MENVYKHSVRTDKNNDRRNDRCMRSKVFGEGGGCRRNFGVHRGKGGGVRDIMTIG